MQLVTGIYLLCCLAVISNAQDPFMSPQDLLAEDKPAAPR